MKPDAKETSKNRLQVVLSHSGVCSRRRALSLILEGHVSVNGHVIREPSTPVNPAEDRVSVDGREIREKALVYVLLHKPKGYVTTVKDKHAEKTVLDLLPQEFRHLYPAGRLDKETEGLLLLTNDGDAAYRLTHPKFNVTKIYAVTIKGSLNEDKKRQLEKGIMLEGKMTAPSKISEMKFAGGKTEFLMAIHEGRKRQIRLMLSLVGCPVLSLKRIKAGPLSLGDLPPGQWRFLKQEEIAAIKKI